MPNDHFFFLARKPETIDDDDEVGEALQGNKQPQSRSFFLCGAIVFLPGRRLPPFLDSELTKEKKTNDDDYDDRG